MDEVYKITTGGQFGPWVHVRHEECSLCKGWFSQEKMVVHFIFKPAYNNFMPLKKVCIGCYNNYEDCFDGEN